MKGAIVTIPRSIVMMTAESTWQPWAEKGWTLHIAPGGRVLAVNVTEQQATNRAKHLLTLVSRLEKGEFGYTRFLTFKQFNRR